MTAYKKKYFLNQLIKNSIIFILVTLSTYLLATSLEFWFRFSSSVRALLFFSIIIGYITALIKWIGLPIYHWANSDQQLSDEKAAEQIGDFFPDLGDKLLNTLQLNHQGTDSALISAAISQRSEEISVFPFKSSVKIKENSKLGRYVIIPTVAILIIALFVPQYFSESTERIIRYDQEFKPTRLFSINLINKELTSFKNEDFTINLQVSGSVIPSEVFILSNGRKHRLTSKTNNSYSHTFKSLQTSQKFQVIAADYTSEIYQLTVVNRPDIKNIEIDLNYPSYIGKQNERVSNIGNLTIPEGTDVKWNIHTSTTQSARISLADNVHEMQKEGDNLYSFHHRFMHSSPYSISLENAHSTNKDSIQFDIEIIKDQHPNITLTTLPDTVTYTYILLNGIVKDDYGLSKLEIVYDHAGKKNSVPIQMDRSINSQSFLHHWKLDNIDINTGSDFSYFVRVWDNDGINGSKSTSSSKIKLRIPGKNEISEKIDQQSVKAKTDLERKIEASKKINEQLEDIQNELRSKNKLDWQDKKRIEDLIDDKKQLEKELKELAQQNEQINQQREQFNKQDERLQEKAAQLQKLMEEVLDEETKQLYEELQKLLEENAAPQQVEEMIEDLQQKEQNMEQELERAIEMFKRMQFEFKMEEIINDLDELTRQQEENADQTESGEKDQEELLEQQNEINKEFEEVSKEMEELEELNDNLKAPEQLDNLDEEEESVEESLEKSTEQLEKNKKKKSSQSQNQAAEGMKKMGDKMKQMQAGMEMQQMQENIENLRTIVENLVKLSFDQEDIMKNFHGVNQSDPRYVTLSQRQLKLKDDAKITEDSLIALSERVFQIQSFVTREVSEMNKHIETSLQYLKDRYQSKAVVNQQYAMTSINNLALLLDDVLQQMMMEMQEASGQPQPGDKQQQKQGQPKSPGLSQLQKELNSKIESLKKSGKSGRQLSEELAKLAAEQERLRNELKKMGDKLQNGQGEKEGGSKSGLKDALKKMEETETDLVNKRITRQTIQRQRDILTRMLKAEDALRERELDQQRKGEEAEERDNKLPPAFEEYLKQKKKEIELLHTVPTRLNPYYKEEVNKYFERLNEQ